MDFKEKTKEAYDKIAVDYNKANFKSFWTQEFEKYKSLLQGKNILDIGSGAGRDAVMFTEADFTYTGIDASLAMLDVAKERAPSGTYMQMDYYHLDFPDNTFDGFWAVASFLHVPKSDIVLVLKEARRVVKEGGIGFISVKQKDGMEEGLIDQHRYGETMSRYFAFYDKEEFSKQLLDAGFEVIGDAMYHEDDERKTTWLGFFVKK